MHNHNETTPDNNASAETIREQITQQLKILSDWNLKESTRDHQHIRIQEIRDNAEAIARIAEQFAVSRFFKETKPPLST